MQYKKHCVVGMGEVGKAVYKLLKEEYDVRGVDKDGRPVEKFDVVHICFPYSKKFKEEVETNYYRYVPKLIIIHSTVPVGTTEALGDMCVHSPVRGVHPHLYEGLKTFKKYFGGPKAKIAANIFSRLVMGGVQAVESAKTTELAKLLDTTYYGWNIMFNKQTKKLCDKYGVDFDVAYTSFNNSYNVGYEKLGRPEVMRPVLKYMDGPTKGHCVLNNCKLLGDTMAKIILRFNSRLDKS